MYKAEELIKALGVEPEDAAYASVITYEGKFWAFYDGYMSAEQLRKAADYLDSCGNPE